VRKHLSLLLQHGGSRLPRLAQQPARAIAGVLATCRHHATGLGIAALALLLELLYVLPQLLDLQLVLLG
jgi:hypothetical protein